MALVRIVAVARQVDVAGLDGTGGLNVLLVLGLPLLGLGLLAGMYWRTRMAVRRFELETPLYLIPLITAATTRSPGTPWNPSDQEDLELDRKRGSEIASLRRRASRLLVAMGVDAVALWAAAAWYVSDERKAPPLEATSTLTVIQQQPAAETLTSDLAATSPAPAPEPPAETTEQVATPPPPPVPEQKAPASASPARERREPVSASASRTSPPKSEAPPIAAAPPVTIPVRRDTAAVEVTTAAPAPQPPALATPTAPVAPDPATVRADAERALEIAVRHVTRELAARRAPGTDDAMRRLADWLGKQRPGVSSGTLADIAVQGTRGEAVLPVTLRWRDDFGVGKQREVRFRVAVERQGDDWVFAGAELLERFP